MTLGFRILVRRHQFDPAVLERFAGQPVANVSDVMSRMTAAGPRLRPMHDGEQGDLIMGDADGLVCVSLAGAEAIAAKAGEKFRVEEAMRERATRGANDRSRIDAALTKPGCETEAG